MKITSSAHQQIIKILENKSKLLRLGVQGSGCNGYSYYIGIEYSLPREHDKTFDFDDFQIVIDKKSYVYLEEAELDYFSTLMKTGFKFNNPKEKSSCGCGKSITF